MADTTQIQQIKRVAFRALNVRWRVLAPASEATVTFPEFDPCKARNPIARVAWPCIVGMRETTATHFVFDGDRL